MEKESYSLDEILSEVKKRREEQAQQLKNETADNAKKEDKEKTEEKSAQKISENVKKENKAAPQKQKKSEKDFVIAEKNGNKQEEVAKKQTVSKEEQPKKEQPVKKQPDTGKKTTQKKEEKPVQAEKKVQKQAKESNKEMPKEEPKGDKSSEMVNILDYTPDTEMQNEYTEENEPVKFFKTKTGKAVKAVIIVLVLLIAAAAVFGGIYIHNALNKISVPQPNNNDSQSEEWSGMNVLNENFPAIEETDASQLSSLQDMIKTWYYNGEPCSSSHVLNVLLIGEDTRGEEILDDETRADAAIIASVNVDTKQITLTSVLRDTYGFWENEKGNDSTAQFGKINGAMSVGDINAYIRCVENLYKINIDNYVIVNFDSFESIIDTVGGVTLEITSAEINEINNHQVRYGYVTIEKDFEGSSGEMKLTGEQALAYCRIRKLDSDNMRADRQKKCLVELFEQVKGSSTANLLKVANTMIDYVKTGFSGDEILSIAKYALSEGWMNYEIVMNTIPNARINERGSGGVYYGEWIWKSDFPQDAYNLQMLLYGKSSITLAQTRVDVLRCELYGFYKEGYAATYATIHNENYGELTTLVTTTKEDEETSSAIA